MVVAQESLYGRIVEMRRDARRGGHGFVLGQPGSGKTDAMLAQIKAILDNTNDTVVVLAADNDYRGLAERVGGQVFEVGLDSRVCVNPLDMCAKDCLGWDVSFSEKVDFVIGWMESGLRLKMTPRQMSLVERVLQKVYGPFISSVDVMSGERDVRLLPTLTDFYGVLCSCEDADAKLLADCLEIFVHGSIQEFAGKTNAVHKSRMVVYDFSQTMHTLRSAAMMAVLESVWARYVNSRIGSGVFDRIWVVVDDVWYLLKSKTTAEYLSYFVKQCRAYGCIFTGVTMDVSALLDWDDSRAMFSNAEYVHLLKMYSGDKAHLKDFLGLDDGDWEKVDGVGLGCGLVLIDCLR